MLASTAHAAGRPGSGISVKSAPALDLPARFMGLAMLGFALVAGLAAVGLPLLLHGFYDPWLLAFVHLNTLGVVAAMIVGAGYQLVPVVLGEPLASVRLGRASFWLYLVGLPLFLVGLPLRWLPGLAIGSTLLLSALALYIGVVAATLLRASARDVVAWHIVAALVSLAGGVSLGVVLAFNKALGFLGGMTLHLMAAHLTLMLAGWVAVMLAGVAYRLVGMFTLSKGDLWHPAAWAGLVSATMGSWVLAASFLLGGPQALRPAAAVSILAGQVLMAGQVMHLYNVRRRRGFDVHIPFVLVAVACGVAAAGLAVAGFARGAGTDSEIWVAAVWLGLAGLAETAIQGFFYKIATFLVWLHRYAPRAGRERVPRLEELYWRRLAVTGWGLWTTGLLGSVAAMGATSDLVARLAGLAMAAGLVCFLVNVVRVAGHGRPIRIGLMEIRLGNRVREPGAEG